MPPKSGRPTDQVDREKSILRAAIALFSNNGIDSTGVRSIAKKSGVSFGLIRHYFGSKADLIKVCNQLAINEIKEYFLAANQLITDNLAADFSEENWLDKALPLLTPKLIYTRYLSQLLISGLDTDHVLFKEYYAIVEQHIDVMDSAHTISKDHAKEWMVLQFIFLQLGTPMLMNQIREITGSSAFSPENVNERMGTMTMTLARGIYENQPIPNS